MRALVVVDLGFGDGGKGLLTDYLVRTTGARLVVRYNGGAQAGHNVVTEDGRHHTFAQLGSGTFVPGVATFLSRDVVVHPTALLREVEALGGQGVGDALSRLHVSDRALVVTPYHQALNRIRELVRGPARHGSCGVGVGEAVSDARRAPEGAVRMGDLRGGSALRDRLNAVRARLRAPALEQAAWRHDDPRVAAEWAAFEDEGLAARWVDATRALAAADVVRPDAALGDLAAEAGVVVLEGAQGVLIGEAHGFPPYTSWTDAGPAPARALLAEAAPEAAVETVGVLRAYMVRHGPGPLPTETDGIAAAVREHNAEGPWQGRVRYGWFDAVLVRYALHAAGGVDTLAVTHGDVPPRLGHWAVCGAYEGAAGDALRPSPTGDPGHQARLTALLERAEPVLDACPPTTSAALDKIERLLGRPVALAARGPRASDVVPYNRPAEVR